MLIPWLDAIMEIGIEQVIFDSQVVLGVANVHADAVLL